MTYLAKVRKCDLSKLAYELGEVVPPESRIVDLKHLILNSQSYEEEFAKQLLETLIEDRERIEERERIEDRKRIEDQERIERERKEQMVMEFELEKLRIQTTRGNNDTSRSTSNDAHYEIRKLMPKYESKDNDLSFYLILFERQAKRLGLDEDQWAFSLLGLLPYEMTQLIARETEEQSGDYRFVKRLLLKRYKLSPEQFRQKFEKHERSQKGSWRDFAFELRGYFNEWIEGMNVENFDALKDLSVTNQLKKKVPNVLRNHLIDDWTKLNNPDELADKLDEYENVRTEMVPPHWNAKHLIPPSFQQKSARFPNQSEVKETKQGTNVSGQDAARNEISETYPNTLRRMRLPSTQDYVDMPSMRSNGTQGKELHKTQRRTKSSQPGSRRTGDCPARCIFEGCQDRQQGNREGNDRHREQQLSNERIGRKEDQRRHRTNSTSLYGIGNQTAPAARTVGKTTVDLEIDGIVGREITVFIVNDDAQPYDLLIGRTWTDLPYVSFARIGKNLHIGYSSEFPFANLQEEIKSRRIELRATETVQLESDSINFTSAITDEVKDGYVLFTGVDDACVDSLLEVVDGKTTVPIISAGKGKLRVRKNQCVGRVELLNLDAIVVNLDVAEDSFQTKNEEKREGQDQMKRKRPILPEDINVNHSLTSKERQEILDVVNEYRDCFALGMEELGCTDVTKMDIKEVDGSKPVCLRPYKTTASEREAIREIVREWKDNGIVTETRSPYASPVLLVRKKTGDHRLVVDYRRLNIQTVKDKFPLPRIDDLLEGLRNAKFFTTLDLAHGYLQSVIGDSPRDRGEVASADEEAARKYPEKLAKIIKDGGYCAHQIFNADETGLFWKKMPTRTYIAKSEKNASGFKAAKDRVTLLLCSNASGDRMLKPLLVNRSLKPRALKGKDLNTLPVHWMANKKAWVTTAIFTEWFNKCFVPEVEDYMKEMGLEFKILLILDNAPGHPNLEHPNIKVVFFPPNTTSLIQPLDQGIISTFKKYYVKFAFQFIFDKLESDTITVTEVWKQFNILNCVDHVALAIAEIKSQTLNACWKAAWPECVSKRNESNRTKILTSDIISITKEIGGEGFDDFGEHDIEELLVDEALNDDDILESMVDTTKDFETVDSELEDVTPLDEKLLREGLQLSGKLDFFFIQNDNDVERALKFQRDLKFCMSGYRELYKELVKPSQRLITDYLVKEKKNH
ncbi:hypothetical protein LAZ67_9002170 [Cordylochernes scorpioides]|uniref:DDE-1 domain-containing protein n=1 Tax=Cordylochernes scorpioides TaxID=51811 RepID=A0ABY6KU98_9ARAC|nr:hypothetical protein LAZ67_9002170 [Cordylochernes scorpioides]